MPKLYLENCEADWFPLNSIEMKFAQFMFWKWGGLNFTQFTRPEVCPGHIQRSLKQVIDVKFA